MKKLILLICILLLSFNSYAEGENYSLELESEKVADENVFNNDVKIIYPDGTIRYLNSFPTEEKYVLKYSYVLSEPNLESYVKDIEKGTKISVIETHDDFSKIKFEDEYYYMITSHLGNEDEIQSTPYHESIPLTEELQSYIYNKCMENGIKYCLFLGLCQQETNFGRYGSINGKQFHNVSKTSDYGMCQTNKKYVWPEVKKVFGWDNIEILFNPYRSVDAGIFEFSKCVAKYGNTEAAYDAYNRGLEHHGSTRNSRAVVRYWNQWKSILGDI